MHKQNNIPSMSVQHTIAYINKNLNQSTKIMNANQRGWDYKMKFTLHRKCKNNCTCVIGSTNGYRKHLTVQ